eukprot:gnl/TRDRNA2_/TRDRNA2_165474_c0_seq1.p1 gnl/TRDRNA2_/TRDRNA2_165474_c0~~gnl/TRDRNA2_/TRDRNA2_165474_c0_seq1.p1  ORF type:complete len:460 (+),score=111.32 gnl/TRDRNA2_/TRDRNA2_165474_c0_seq1:188-1381(+)
MLAAAHAGAHIVDAAMDSMSGLTSQPSLGALVNAVKGTPLDTGICTQAVNELSDYWEQVRLFYTPFDCTIAGLKSTSSEVYLHEIPGGQYTNLHMQAFSLGLSNQWREIKAAYVEANDLMGDIIKATPSSKAVGDLAQFMVQNELTTENFVEDSEGLSFPNSVVEYFQGYLGQPPFGFPADIQQAVLKGAPVLKGRPGDSLEPIDWEQLRVSSQEKHGRSMSERELVSAAMYPKVYDDYIAFRKEYGDVSVLPTCCYFDAMVPGEEIVVNMYGREVKIKYITKGAVLPDGSRDIFFEVSGVPRTVNVPDESSTAQVKKNVKADTKDPKQLAAPMPGNLVEYKVQVGDIVETGAPLMVLTAMKMETLVLAPAGPYRIEALPVAEGAAVEAGDLLVQFA